jgi:hypothetical protein
MSGFYIGKGWLHMLKAIPSSLHQKLCFPMTHGVMEIKGNQVASKQCITVMVKQTILKAKKKGKTPTKCSRP